VTGTRKVRWYLQAREEYDTLARQLDTYPELKDSRQHRLALNEARVAMLTALNSLTGGQLAQARRLAA
jgi:hypothetical protein